MFKNKTIGFYIRMAGACVAFITAVIYLIGGIIDNSFFVLIFILLLLGVAVDVVSVFKYYSVMPVIAAICYGAALGVYLGNMLTNVVNTFVNMAENSLPLFFVLCVFMFIAAACGALACFMKQQQTLIRDMQ